MPSNLSFRRSSTYLFSSAVKCFFQSPTIPFRMNSPFTSSILVLFVMGFAFILPKDVWSDIASTSSSVNFLPKKSAIFRISPLLKKNKKKHHNESILFQFCQFFPGQDHDLSDVGANLLLFD